MNNLEISYLMRSHPHFIGVFARDKLPTPIQPNTCFIVNTDSSNLPGTHWIAIKVNSRKQAFYYDPLAFPPIHSVCNFLLRFVRTIYYLENSDQHINSNLCGLYCIQFLNKV